MKILKKSKNGFKFIRWDDESLFQKPLLIFETNENFIEFYEMKLKRRFYNFEDLYNNITDDYNEIVDLLEEFKDHPDMPEFPDREEDY